MVIFAAKPKKPISAPVLDHFSFHLGDIQDGYLKPHSLLRWSKRTVLQYGQFAALGNKY